MINGRHFLIAAMMAVLGACGGDGAADSEETPGTVAASNNQGEEDLQDVGKFKLSMDRMDKYFQAQLNIGVAASKMSEAELEAAQMSGDGNESLDQMVKNAERSPVINKAIRDAGLSPREYVMITMAYMQSAMATAVLQMQPNANQDSLMREMQVNPDNIAFIRNNEAALRAKAEKAAAEMKALGIDTD